MVYTVSKNDVYLVCQFLEKGKRQTYIIKGVT